MHNPRSIILLIILGICIEFTIATALDPFMQQIFPRKATSVDLIHVLLGNARELLANHLIKKADVYFHAGYYPSIFHEAAQARSRDHLHSEEYDEHAHEKEMSFLSKPKDIIDRFGRYFYPTEHRHLHGHETAEILPWLKFAASVDPQNVESYVITAFWLRRELHKPDQAEAFLREGLKANPNNLTLLYELARLRWEEYADPLKATNLLHFVLNSLRPKIQQEPNPEQIEIFHRAAILLAHIYEQQRDFKSAVSILQQTLELNTAPKPEVIQQKIEELNQHEVEPPTNQTCK